MVAAISGIAAFLPGCGSSPKPAAAPQDYIAAEASALHHRPGAIEAFVDNNIVMDPSYTGSLRGPVGTLWDGAGDTEDRADLLCALLSKTSVHHRLVTGSGGVYGVETQSGSTWTWAGPGPAPSTPTTPVASWPGADQHELLVTVSTLPHGQDQPTSETVAIPTASLSGRHLRLSYVHAGAAVHAVLSIGTPGATDGSGSTVQILLTSTADAATADSQDLIFTTAGPGESAPMTSRELFSNQFSDYPSYFDPGNRYDIVATTGWVTNDVRTTEEKFAGVPKDPVTARDAAVAYTYLAQSDTDTHQLMTSHSIGADVTSPRVTIVSDEVDTSVHNGARSVSLDLRVDGIAVPGANQETTAAFSSTRSLLDASLEDGVLQQVTGQSAWSAMSAMANSLNGAGPSDVYDRQVVLQKTLTRMLGDDHQDGSAFTIWPSTDKNDSVTFTTTGDTLKVSVSPAVATALARAKGEDAWITHAPPIDSNLIVRAAADAEVALVETDHLPAGYTDAYSYGQAPAAHWYDGGRLFDLGTAPDGTSQVDYFETQILPTTDGSWSFDAISYWDSVNNQFWPDGGHESTITVNPSDVKSATTFAEWFQSGSDDTAGRTWDAISQQALHELETAGSTVLRYQQRDGSTTQPIRFFLEKKIKVPEYVNSVPIEVDALMVRGVYDAPGVSKPQETKTGWSNPDINDAADNGVINTQFVLDDPAFPMLVNNAEHVQSSIPGTVDDAQTGQGIDGATINVAGPDSQATSWPGGSFALPLFKQPFDKFEVTVSAPGYQSYDQTLDFRLASTLPLHIALQKSPPSAPTVVWVDEANISSTLPSTSLSSHSQQLISQAISLDPHLGAFVPSATIYGPAGPTDAWLEVDTRTGAAYGVLSDGLHGSTGRLAGTCAKAVGTNAGTSAATGGTPDPTTVPGCAISYFAGRIAAWYLYAAGALDSVNQMIQGKNLSMPDFHKNAIAVARQLAGIYNGWALTVAGLAGVGNNTAFLQGLADGLDWADQFYGAAFGTPPPGPPAAAH